MRYFYRFLLIIALTSISSTQVMAQQYMTSVSHFSLKDGLSHRQVYHTFEDSKGFLWVSTEFGINRYDGKQFKVFSRTEHGFSSSISYKILEDKNGKIWFQHFMEYVGKGPEPFWIIDIFDPESERAELLTNHFELPFSSADIHWMEADNHRNIWISLKNGQLFKYNGSAFELIVSNAPHQLWEDLTVTTDGRIGMLKGQ